MRGAPFFLINRGSTSASPMDAGNGAPLGMDIGVANDSAQNAGYSGSTTTTWTFDSTQTCDKMGRIYCFEQ